MNNKHSSRRRKNSFNDDAGHPSCLDALTGCLSGAYNCFCNFFSGANKEQKISKEKKKRTRWTGDDDVILGYNINEGKGLKIKEMKKKYFQNKTEESIIKHRNDLINKNHNRVLFNKVENYTNASNKIDFKANQMMSTPEGIIIIH